MNTFTTQPGIDAFSRDWLAPNMWGAFPRSNPNGPGILYEVENYPGAAQQAVAGISWRQAGRFCNWLHNNKSSDLSAIVTGAYDTTTWGGGIGGVPATDDERHLPGARFWIPSFDEWAKAAHFDPDKHGPGIGGWWMFPNRSDVLPVSGAPGIGQTNAGTELWEIPVGSYPSTRSAYGLLDLSGGAREWLEEISQRGPAFYTRRIDGTCAREGDTAYPDLISLDDIQGWGGA